MAEKNVVQGAVLGSQSLPHFWGANEGNLHTRVYGKLTRFWAQEGMGIPEAQMFLARMSHPFAPTKIGILDNGFSVKHVVAELRIDRDLRTHLSANLNNTEVNDYVIVARMLPPSLRNLLEKKFSERRIRKKTFLHGTAVAHLVAGMPPVGTSSRGEISLLIPLFNAYGVENEEIEVFKIIAEMPLPQLINYSRQFASYSAAQAREMNYYIKKISQKTLFVTSAGNQHPKPIEGTKNNLAQSLIIVGSSDPTGHRSTFSQTGEAETIRALSDNHLQTKALDPDGYYNFGGTSGATPIVTGALADALSIVHSPLSRSFAQPFAAFSLLTPADVQLLLKKTAIPNPSGDQVGILNFYKLVRVAQRLAEHDGNLTSFLQEDSLYDFSIEAKELQREALSSSSTTERFAKLRLSFFLNYNNPDVRTQLANIYRQAGYVAQSFFYDNPNSAHRNIFVATRAVAAQTLIIKFISALAEADIATMTQLITDADFDDITSFIRDQMYDHHTAVSEGLRALPPADLQKVKSFLLQHKISTDMFFEEDLSEGY